MTETPGFFTFIFTCSFWMSMRQIGQLNLTVNARKMSIPVTRRGGKTFKQINSTTLCVKVPRQHTAKIQHREETSYSNTNCKGTQTFSSPTCDLAHTLKKSQTSPNEIQRSIYFPLLQLTALSALIPRRGFNQPYLIPIYIFNK